MTQHLYLDLGYKVSGLQPGFHKVQSEMDSANMKAFVSQKSRLHCMTCENILVANVTKVIFAL